MGTPKTKSVVVIRRKWAMAVYPIGLKDFSEVYPGLQDSAYRKGQSLSITKHCRRGHSSNGCDHKGLQGKKACL